MMEISEEHKVAHCRQIASTDEGFEGDIQSAMLGSHNRLKILSEQNRFENNQGT
jgi:hypothetical protein